MPEHNQTQPLKKLVIVGGGQMGTSTALAAKLAYPDTEIVVLDVNPALEKEFKDKFAAEGVPYDKMTFTTDPRQTNAADLVVLAAPISQFPLAVEEVAPYLKDDTALTDIGSVKELSIRRIKKAIKALGLKNAYVPFHILNGNAGEGPLTGSKTVYNAPAVLVPNEADLGSQNRVKDFFAALGSKIFLMEAPKHDKLLGTMSHLEYVAMFSFMETNLMKDALELDGLTDPGNWVQRMTRIADASPETYTSIFADNKKQILESAEHFRAMLVDLRDNLDERLKEVDGNNTKDGLHHFANTTLGPDLTYTKEKPNFPMQPFEPDDFDGKDLRLTAMASALSFAITKNGNRVQDETQRALGEIANPSFKDGLGPMAVAPEVAKQVMLRYRDEMPQMIDDFLISFDSIITKVQGLDLDNSGNDNDQRGNHSRNCYNALKKMIRSISANRRDLPRTFSRTLARFGTQVRASMWGSLTAPQPL